jgi:hypothetical protein
MSSSATSKIKCTPFYLVTLPTKPKTTIWFSNYEHPKYFFYNISLALRWSLFVLSIIILNLYSLLIPFGNANGLWCLRNTDANGDVSNNSNL